MRLFSRRKDQGRRRVEDGEFCKKCGYLTHDDNRELKEICDNLYKSIDEIIDKLKQATEIARRIRDGRRGKPTL